jgi:hypothetical protein
MSARLILEPLENSTLSHRVKQPRHHLHTMLGVGVRSYCYLAVINNNNKDFTPLVRSTIYSMYRALFFKEI